MCRSNLDPFVAKYIAGLAQLEAGRLRPDLISHLVCGQTACWADEKLWAKRMSVGPLAVPLIGQFLMYLKSAQVAEGWFRLALPKGTDKAIQDDSFIKPVLESIRAGAAYCLASVLQSVLETDQTKFEGPLIQKALPQRAVILWGSKDRSHRPSKKDSLLQYFEPGNASFVELVTCGHFPDLEYEYSEHLTQMVSF
jgi:pimeloyl-ACP methyl ester carboxylesterase